MDKIKVLLVDDEKDFLKVMGVRLKDWGYDLIEAQNAKEALEAVISKGPDAVILDYMLPDMDGISVLREIRKIDAKLPVIMFTAHPDAKAIKDSTDLSVNAFIPKFSVYSEVIPSLKTALEMATKKKEK